MTHKDKIGSLKLLDYFILVLDGGLDGDHLDPVCGQLFGRGIARIPRESSDAVRLVGCDQRLYDAEAWFPVAPTTTTSGAEESFETVMTDCAEGSWPGNDERWNGRSVQRVRMLMSM